MKRNKKLNAHKKELEELGLSRLISIYFVSYK
jgi:hypothetical protein